MCVVLYLTVAYSIEHPDDLTSCLDIVRQSAERMGCQQSILLKRCMKVIHD